MITMKITQNVQILVCSVVILLASISQGGAYSFSNGSRVQTTADLVVHATHSTVGTYVTTETEGSRGTIASSSYYDGTYTWWYINWANGYSGYSVDAYLEPAPTLTVTSPNGGENWSAGSTHSVTWTSSGDTSAINYQLVALSTDGGSTYNNIGSTQTASSRLMSWTIPSGTSSTQARIRVRAMDVSAYILAEDTSDGNFTISTVTAPTVSTSAASSVTTTSAQLNGTVNPNGSDTTVYFQYGLTTGYGNNTGSGDFGSGTTTLSGYSSISSLTPNTGYHYRIVAYNNGGTNNGGDMPFTTLPLPRYTLTLTANPAGGGSISANPPPDPSDGKYASGAVVQLTANANTAAGYSFTGWSGDASGSANPVSVTMSANKNVTASFTQPRYTLTLTANPAGGGSISANPPPDPSDGKYASGTVVQLTANANTAAGYGFTSWSGDASGSANPVSVTMSADKNVTASFTQTRYTLTLTANPAGGGSISANPPPDPSDGKYASGAVVQLTANANTAAGYSFTGWSGDASGSANPVSVTMNGNKSVGATFVGRPPNDDFANRIVLSGLVVATAGQNTNATKEAGEPNHAGAKGGKSVWWAWTAPASGTVTISTAGSSFDTVLGLYTGSTVSSLTEVASNDDESGNTSTSLIVTNVVGGTAYAIAVDGYGGEFGSISLTVSNSAPTLCAARTGNQLVVSWGTNWDGYLLESAKKMIPGATTWEQVTPAPVVVGGYYVVTNAMSRPQLFYRLRHP